MMRTLFKRIRMRRKPRKASEATPEDIAAIFRSLGDAVDWEGLRLFLTNRWPYGGLHGLPHWDNVLRHGMMLCDREPLADRVVVACFAYLHDSCRVNDGDDPDHGPRASVWVETLRTIFLGNLTEQQFVLLQKAIAGHTVCRSDEDHTVSACYDADRLDLIRAGIVPRPEMMAGDAGRKIALERMAL